MGNKQRTPFLQFSQWKSPTILAMLNYPRGHIESQQPKNLLLIGIASLVLGVLVLGFFAVWPMYQVTQHANGITIYFKGILLGAFLTVFAINLVLLKGKGIPWKRNPGIPLTRLQIGATIISCIAAMLVAGLVWLFFYQHGYQLMP
jgi:hypothetical protein